MPICFWLLTHCARRLWAFARDNAVRSRAARIAMIAMVTSNSTNVNARSFFTFVIKLRTRMVDKPFPLEVIALLPARRRHANQNKAGCARCRDTAFREGNYNTGRAR